MTKYVRRSDAEVELIRKRLIRESRRPWEPLFIGLGVGLILPAFEFVIGSEVHKPLEADFSFLVTLGLVFGFAAFLITYYRQIKSGRGPSRGVYLWLCASCKKKHEENLKECDCGGVVEPIEFYSCEPSQ